MKNRSKLATLALSSSLAIAGFAGLAGPASAGTVTTFTLTGGALAISAPTATVALTTTVTGTILVGGATAAGQLGNVTVDDTRGLLLNGWTTTVSSTTFVTGTGTPTPDETVAVTNIKYSSGGSTSHSGLGVFVPTVTPTLGTVATYTGAAGNSSTTWNPTLTFTLLSSQVAGTYTGTVTHSVA